MNKNIFSLSIRYYLIPKEEEFERSLIDKNALILIKEFSKRTINQNEILQLLEDDDVDLKDVSFIRVYQEKIKAYQKLEEEIEVEIPENNTIKLKVLTKIKDENFIQEEKLLSKASENLEKRKNKIKKLLQTESSDVIYEKGNDNYIHLNQDFKVPYFAFIYSNPLVVTNLAGNIIPIKNKQIDYVSEQEMLVNLFEEANKEINVQIDIANFENLYSIIEKSPTILHISCHGLKKEGQPFSLLFEDEFGKTKKLNVNELDDFFSYQTNSEPIMDLAFISACFSGAAAKAFTKICKCVICVNPETKILDEIAQKFTGTFYKSILEGKSISQSYEKAKADVQPNEDSECCCCLHGHNNNCKGFEHKIHTPKRDEGICKCEFSRNNAHTLTCTWANKRVQNHGFKKIEKGDIQLVCCCQSPDMPHSESEKFQIETHPNYKDFIYKQPFLCNIKEGKYKIVNSNCYLNYKICSDYKTGLLGRNKILYDIIVYLCSKDSRLVCIYNSEEGYEKKKFSKYLGKYIFERGLFPDNVFFIDVTMDIQSEREIEEAIIFSVNYQSQFNSFDDFLLLYKNSRALLIIYFNSEEKEDMVSKVVNHILKQTIKIKIVYVSLQKIKTEEPFKEVRLGPIDNEDIAELLLEVTNKDKIPDKYKIKDNLKKHDLVKWCKGIPRNVYLIDFMLRKEENTFDTLYSKILSVESYEEKLKEEIKKKFNDYSKEMKQILLLLVILPTGLLRETIQAVFGEENFEDLKNNYLFSSSKKYNKSEVYTLNYNKIKITDFFEYESYLIQAKEKLIIYHSSLFRFIINSQRKNYCSKPKEFSALADYSIWKEFEPEEKTFKDESGNRTISELKKYFGYLYKNISILLLNYENHSELTKLQHDKLNKAVEDISITLPTILKIFNQREEIDKIIELLYAVLDEFNLTRAKYRLILFEFGENKKISVLEKLPSKPPNEDELLAERYIITGLIPNEDLELLNKAEKKYIEKKDEFGTMRVIYLKADILSRNEKKISDSIGDYIDKGISFSERTNNLWYECKFLTMKIRYLLRLKGEFVEFDKIFEAILKKVNHLKLIDRESIHAEVENLKEKVKLEENKKQKILFKFLIHHPFGRGNFKKKRSEIEEIEESPPYCYRSFLRYDMTKILKSSEKKIISSFENLSIENLRNSFINTGKFLFVSSEFFLDSSNSLYIDDSRELGLEKFLNNIDTRKINPFRNFYDTGEVNMEKFFSYLVNEERTGKGKYEIKYDIVVLGFPNSKNLVEILKKLNIKYTYLICFDVDEKIYNLSYFYLNKSIPNFIEIFTCDFLENFLENEGSVKEIFDLCAKDLNNTVTKLIKKINSDFNLSFEVNKKNNICFLYSGYENKPIDPVSEGKFEDVSRIPQVNFEKVPFLGDEMQFKLIVNAILEHNIINVFSSDQVSPLSSELASFFTIREFFREGIFILDLKNLVTLEKITDLVNSKLKNENHYDIPSDDFMKKKLIILLNPEESILRKQDLLMDYFYFLTKQLNGKVVILSKNNIESSHFQIHMRKINLINSIILFLFYSGRVPEKVELYRKETDEQKSTFQILLESRLFYFLDGNFQLIQYYGREGKVKKISTLEEIISQEKIKSSQKHDLVDKITKLLKETEEKESTYQKDCYFQAEEFLKDDQDEETLSFIEQFKN